MRRCQEPRPLPANRQSGQVDALRVAVELGHGGVERFHRHGVHHAMPAHVGAQLRHHHDQRKARAFVADGRGQANGGLVQPVVAAFARAMQEQRHRPFSIRRVVGGHEDLVAVGHAVDGDAAVEETGLDRRMVLRVGRAPGARREGQHQACRGQAHGYFAAINAAVISSIRLLKPHSLSYQASTFTRVPPVTLVRVLS